MDASYERTMSSSSYFAHVPPRRLLLRVYAAEKLRHVSSHGTYCKIYVGGSAMVRGSGVFSRRSQKLSSSTSSFLHTRRGNTLDRSTTRLAPMSLSMVDGTGSQSQMRVLKTNVQKGKQPSPVWNEKFDIALFDLEQDVLSIRVKSARLMSTPAIGACSIPLKDLLPQGASTIDRWFELKLGKKDAGRIRLQLRFVDASLTRRQDSGPAVVSTQPRNGQGTDPHLSILDEESPLEMSARTLKKMTRRDHKYHRSGRRYDGRSLNSSALSSSKISSDGSCKSSSDKRADQKRAPTITTSRNNSDSATSNESEPASDVSVSPVASERATKEDIRDQGDLSDSVHRGTMRISELERSRMRMDTTKQTARIRPSRSSNKSSQRDGDLDRLDSFTAANHWTGDHTKLSMLSSNLDLRESSRISYDDESVDGRYSLAKRKTSSNHGSISIALSSSATSTVEHLDNSLFSLNDSDDDSEEDAEIESEKAREKQRQQWQMEQRKMQLARFKEVSQSMSDEDRDNNSADEDDDGDDGLGRERKSTRIHFTPTLTKLLGRESMNVLFENEDDTEEEEGPEAYKLSDDYVPMLEASSPRSFDLVDSALRLSSFD